MSKGERAGTRMHMLTRDDIISASLKLVDEEGLNALSFRALGKRLGVSQTAFYRHIPDKTALLDGVSEKIWRQTLERLLAMTAPGAETRSSAESWHSVMLSYARTLRRTLLAHPNAVELVLTHPIATARSFSLIAQVLVAFDAAGFQHPDHMLALFTAVTVYTTGFAAAEAAPPAGGEVTSPLAGFNEALSSMSPADRQALEGLVGQVMTGSWDFSSQFEVGLQALLRGWDNTENRDMS